MLEEETLKSLAVEIAMDSGSFSQGVKDLKNQLGIIDSEFKAGIAGAKNWGNTLDGLQANATALGQKIDVQKKIVQQYAEQLKKSEDVLTANSEKMIDLKTKVEAAKNAWDDSKAAIGANTEATQKLKDEYVKINNQYESAESLVRKNQSSVQGYTIQLNNANGALNSMEAKLAETNKEIEQQSNAWIKAGKSMEEAGRKIKETGDKLTSAGQSLTTKVTAPILAAGAAVAVMSTTFEDGMAKVSTVADETAVSLEDLGDDVLELSDDTGQAFGDIQEGLYDAISAGVDTAESMDFMTVSVKAAKGGFTDTKTAVDGLTTTLNSYGLEADKATIIANQMMVAQNLGKTTFGEMASSIGNVVPTAAALNVQTSELFSSMAALTANGIKTNESVTGLKAAYSNILKPTADAADEAKRLGLQFDVTHLQAVGWGNFLEEVKEKVGGNVESMAKLFGSTEAVNTILTLTSDQGLALFNESMNQMASGTDYVNEAFEKVTSTSGQEFKKSLNELKNSGIELGESLTPVVKEIAGAMHSLSEILKSMTPEQQRMIITMAGIAAATGPVILGVGATAKAFGSILEAGGKLTQVLGITRVATTAVGTASTIAAGAGTAGGIAGLGASLGAAAVAAGPWLIAGAAVVGIGYGINKAMSKEAIPAVDLFADKVTMSAEQINTANKSIMTSEGLKTVTISEGTKKAVNSYLELDEEAEKSLMNLYVNGTKITKQTADKMATNYLSMSNQIKDGLDKQNQQQLTDMQSFFAKSSALSDAEEAKALAKIKEFNESQKNEIDKNYDKIIAIYNKAAKENREIKASEAQEISQINQKMKEDAVKVLSEQEIESKVILERMKSYGDRITAEQASEIIKNANKQRDGAVSAAEQQYEQTLREIIRMRDEAHIITADQAKKLIDDAERQRSVSVQKAEELRTQVVQKMKEMNADITRQISDKDGSIKTGWISLRDWFDSHPIIRKILTDIGEGYAMQGYAAGVGQNASGTSSWSGGLTTIHERGYELYDLPTGTRIYNHDASEELVRKTAESVAKQVMTSAKSVTSTIDSLLRVDKLVIANDLDIQTIANKLEFYRAQAAAARGGA